MTFGFTAVGNKQDVITQLETADIPAGPDRFNDFGLQLRDLLITHFKKETVTWPGQEHRYIVKAFGHGGGNVPLSVTLTVEPFTIPVKEPATVSGLHEAGYTVTAEQS